MFFYNNITERCRFDYIPVPAQVPYNFFSRFWFQFLPLTGNGVGTLTGIGTESKDTVPVLIGSQRYDYGSGSGTYYVFFCKGGGGSDFTCVMFMPIVSWKVLIITSRIDVLPLFRNSQDFHVDLWPMAHWPWSRKPAPTTTDSIVSSRMAASHPELQQVLVNTKFIVTLKFVEITFSIGNIFM
jgi:hypothetical protein